MEILARKLNEAEDLEYYRSINSCPVVVVNNTDAIAVHGWTIYVHEDGRASKIKGRVEFTPWQFRQLLRTMVEDGLDIEDWSCVDLSGWVED